MTSTSNYTHQMLKQQLAQMQATGNIGRGAYPFDDDEVPAPKSLRQIFKVTSNAAREASRKFWRVTLVALGLAATVVGIIFTARGLSLFQGNTYMTTTTSATAFNAKYVFVPHTFLEFAAPLSVAVLCLAIALTGLIANWRLRGSRSDKSDVKFFSLFWGLIGGIAWIVAGFAAAFTTVSYSNSLQNEAANNWLVQHQHVLSDTDYAGQVDNTKEYLTRNTDGKLVAFTISRDGDGLHVLMHDAPTDAQAR